MVEVVDPREVDREIRGPDVSGNNNVEWLRFLRALAEKEPSVRMLLLRTETEYGDSETPVNVEERTQQPKSIEQIDNLLRMVDEHVAPWEHKSAIVDTLLIERKKLSDW